MYNVPSEESNMNIDLGITAQHVVAAREYNLPENEHEGILLKASAEGLTVAQMRRVIEAVGAARSSERRQYLMDCLYSPFQHDAELERERPPHPVIAGKASTIDWHLYPDASRIINKLTRWEKEDIPKMRGAGELNKLAPEAGRFIARRISRVERVLANLRKELEEKHGLA